MTSDEFFKRILDPNAGYRCVAEQEARERQRWEHNAFRRHIVLDKRVSRISNTVVSR